MESLKDRYGVYTNCSTDKPLKTFDEWCGQCSRCEEHAGKLVPGCHDPKEWICEECHQEEVAEMYDNKFGSWK